MWVHGSCTGSATADKHIAHSISTQNGVALLLLLSLLLLPNDIASLGVASMAAWLLVVTVLRPSLLVVAAAVVVIRVVV